MYLIESDDSEESHGRGGLDLEHESRDGQPGDTEQGDPQPPNDAWHGGALDAAGNCVGSGPGRRYGGAHPAPEDPLVATTEHHLLRLTKHHGLGNDFLVALADQNPDLQPDAARARAVCDRRSGVGADGLILALAPSEPENDACMVLLNADGSEAEISGNGIRCLGQALLRHDGRSEGDLRIETAGGVRELRTVRGDADAEIWMQVDMGAAGDGPEPGPLTLGYGARRSATREIGNPHLVLLVDDPARVDLAVDGPALEAEYPGGMNVHFVAVTGPDELSLAVWERGAGITEACGSGATVAAAVANEWGLVGEHVSVVMPGGGAIVDITGTTLLLTGPAVFVAEVVVP